MSGPIVPPLTVSDEADGGSVSGRPITTIEVTSGTLTVSGRVATLDTSGSGGSPATPANSIQFNSDPAGTFTGSAQFLYETGSNQGQIQMKTGNASTQAEIRSMEGHGLFLTSSDLTGGTSAPRNKIYLYGENDTPDGIMLDAASGQVVKVSGGLSTAGSTADLILSTYDDEDKAKITLEAGAGGGVVIQTDAAGVLQLENTTTDTDSVLSIMGNGTGDAKLDLQNASKRVWVLCDENKKLKIQGGAAGNTFIFDVSSASGGITFPDSTVQTTAASGGSAYSPILPNTPIEAASASDMYCLNGYAPYGNGNNSSTTMWGNTNGDRMFLYPFVAPATLTITNLEIYIAIAAGSACNGLCAFFTDSNGAPSTLMGKTSVDVTSTGAKVMTAFLDSADASTTISLTAGTQYWFCFGRDTTDVSFAFYGTNSYSRVMVCMVGAANFTANGQNVLRTIAETLAVPASFTATNLEPYSSVFAMTALIN